MTDLGDLLGIAPAPTPRPQAPCRNPRCRLPVYVDRAVYGYGEDCAETLGLVVHRGRCNHAGQTGPDLLDELDALAAAGEPMSDPGGRLAPTLPALAELDTPDPCSSCRCCPADLCAAATTDGTACVLLAPPRPTRESTELVLLCPCAPVVCQCVTPAHVRGVTRCHHRRSVEAHALPNPPAQE